MHKAKYVQTPGVEQNPARLKETQKPSGSLGLISNISYTPNQASASYSSYNKYHDLQHLSWSLCNHTVLRRFRRLRPVSAYLLVPHRATVSNS